MIVSPRFLSSWVLVLLGLIYAMLGLYQLAASGPHWDGSNTRESSARALRPLPQWAHSGWTSAVKAEFTSLKDLIAQSKHQPERRQYWETAARQVLQQ